MTTVNLQEAREARAAELLEEEQELRDIIASATPEGAEEEEGPLVETLPDVRVNEGVSVDEIIAAYGALQLRFEKQAAELARIGQLAVSLREKLEKAQNTIATKNATIQNLARRLRGSTKKRG
jgi:hypothetical protein